MLTPPYSKRFVFYLPTIPDPIAFFSNQLLPSPNEPERQKSYLTATPQRSAHLPANPA